MSRQNNYNEQTMWEKTENWVADKVEDIIFLFGRRAYNAFYPIGCDRRVESLNLVGLIGILSLIILVGGITIGNDMRRHNSAYAYSTQIEKYEDEYEDKSTQDQVQQVKSDKVYLIEETDFDKWVCNKLGLDD